MTMPHARPWWVSTTIAKRVADIAPITCSMESPGPASSTFSSGIRRTTEAMGAVGAAAAAASPTRAQGGKAALVLAHDEGGMRPRLGQGRHRRQHHDPLGDVADPGGAEQAARGARA